MKKYSAVIITAVLIGIFIPVFEFFIVQNTTATLRISEKSRERNVKQLLELAAKSYYEGNLESAENYYQEVLDYNPFNLESRRNLAVLYNEKNELDKENKILLKTAALSGETDDLLELAKSFYKIDNSRAALYLLENKIDAKNLSSKEQLFRKYYYSVKSSLALNDLKKAEENLEKISGLDINRSQFYQLQAELAEAEADFMAEYDYLNKSYQADKSQTFLFKDMAEALERAGEEIESYNYWQKSLAFGLFEKTADQRINYLQFKYPLLKPDEDFEEVEEINPFKLRADWKDITPISGIENPQFLRIGLQDNNRHLLFQYSDPFSIIYDAKIIFKGQAKRNYLLEINDDNLYLRDKDENIKIGSLDGEYEIYSSRDNSSFYVYNISYGEGYFWQSRGNRQYRGSMIIRAEEDNFSLINRINLTEYLISVVPSEIYSSWPEESLKAQAVAARSYTLSNLGRHSSQGYDLCSTVHCAAYNGVQNENQRTTNAVLATHGEAAFYEDKVIEAVFSSNSGGKTERSDQIWSADLPYLRGANQMKDDNYQFPLNPAELKEWVRTSPPSYSQDFGSSNYRWHVKIPAEIIESNSGISQLKSIEIVERADGGTITSLKIKGEDQEKTYSSSGIRRLFGGIRSSRIYIESFRDKAKNIKEVYIYGAGWGHNLGLDQSAAAGMAESGWEYQQIIKHFYPGIEIKKIN
ncbi:MAG: SpoIID/LytB domain-containing protein [Halanaerobium sp.]